MEISLKNIVMTPLENLYYAAGELAYVVARADGGVQTEERLEFSELLKTLLSEGGSEGVDVSSIIFQLLDRKKSFDSEATYKMAMDTIRLNGHYLSPSLKQKFTRLMEKVAEAFPPVTPEERQIIKRFRDDIAPIAGDPVYYSVH
jgi:uncharacterized tellurite resistance protein B-like protein